MMENKDSICFLAPGNSIHSYKWINYFSMKGYKITWISLGINLYKETGDIKYYELKKFSFFSVIQNIIKIKLIVKTEKSKIFHVHSLGAYGLLSLFFKQNQFISTAWGSDVIFGKNNFLKKIILQKIIKKSVYITCDAFHMRKKLLDLGAPKNKIKIINFGIDTDRFKPSKTAKPSFISAKKISVISTRNFEEIYDVKTLILSIPIVLQKRKDIYFYFIGKGSLEKDLLELVNKLNINSHVKFLGYIDNKILPNTLASFDIYVSTSLSDAGIAASTAEAMACAVPVVVTNSGENSYWIKNGINGYLVPIRSPIELAKKIITLSKNKRHRKTIGKRGMKDILKNNSYKKEMDKVELLYTSASKR